jgi:L-rhamnose mutarotase
MSIETQRNCVVTDMVRAVWQEVCSTNMVLRTENIKKYSFPIRERNNLLVSVISADDVHNFKIA